MNLLGGWSFDLHRHGDGSDHEVIDFHYCHWRFFVIEASKSSAFREGETFAGLAFVLVAPFQCAGKLRSGNSLAARTAGKKRMRTV